MIVRSCSPLLVTHYTYYTHDNHDNHDKNGSEVHSCKGRSPNSPFSRTRTLDEPILVVVGGVDGGVDGVGGVGAGDFALWACC